MIADGLARGAALSRRDGTGGRRAFLNGGAKRFGDDLGVLSFQLRLDLGRDLEKLPVARLPDFQKGARIEAARDGAALVQALLEGLTHYVFFKPLAAGILQDPGEPKEFLAVQFGQRILRVGHGALKL